MKYILIACALGSLITSCKKKAAEVKKAPMASAADTTDAEGWSGLNDKIPASWQTKDLK